MCRCGMREGGLVPFILHAFRGICMFETSKKGSTASMEYQCAAAHLCVCPCFTFSQKKLHRFLLSSNLCTSAGLVPALNTDDGHKVGARVPASKSGLRRWYPLRGCVHLPMMLLVGPAMGQIAVQEGRGGGVRLVKSLLWTGGSRFGGRGW